MITVRIGNGVLLVGEVWVLKPMKKFTIQKRFSSVAFLTLAIGIQCWGQETAVGSVEVGGEKISLIDAENKLLDSSSSMEEKGRLFDAIVELSNAEKIPVLKKVIESQQKVFAEASLDELIDISDPQYVGYIVEKIKTSSDQSKLNLIESIYAEFKDVTFKMSATQFAATRAALVDLSTKMRDKKKIEIDRSAGLNVQSELVQATQILSLDRSPASIEAVNSYIELFPNVTGKLGLAGPKWLALGRLGSISNKNVSWGRQYLANSAGNTDEFVGRICVAAALSSNDIKAKKVVVDALRGFFKNPGYKGKVFELNTVLFGFRKDKSGKNVVTFGQYYLAMSALAVMNIADVKILLKEALNSSSLLVQTKAATLLSAKFPADFTALYKADAIKGIAKTDLDLVAAYVGLTHDSFRVYLSKKWSTEHQTDIRLLLQVQGVPHRYSLIGALSYG